MTTQVRCATLCLAAAAVLTGCASKCGSNCPPTQVDVYATRGENLAITDAQWTGPACPPYRPSCRGDQFYPCEHLSIVPLAAGTCDLTLKFSDRPDLTVHAEFGPPVQQGCCHGFPVLGLFTITVPPLDAGTPADGPADAGADASNDGADADADITPG